MKGAEIGRPLHLVSQTSMPFKGTSKNEDEHFCMYSVRVANLYFNNMIIGDFSGEFYPMANATSIS